MGVRSVIDLRHDHEADAYPSVLARAPGMRYARIPLYFDHALLRDSGGPNTLADLYRDMLENARPGIADVMRALSQPDAYPVLVHCTAGKDRTGLIIALVLGLLRVPESVIADDYALSGEFLAPHLDELRAMGRERGADPAKHERMLEARPDAMLHALKWLRHRYSDVEGYLRVIGITATEIGRIRESLLD